MPVGRLAPRWSRKWTVLAPGSDCPLAALSSLPRLRLPGRRRLRPSRAPRNPVGRLPHPRRPYRGLFRPARTDRPPRRSSAARPQVRGQPSGRESVGQLTRRLGPDRGDGPSARPRCRGPQFPTDRIVDFVLAVLAQCRCSARGGQQGRKLCKGSHAAALLEAAARRAVRSKPMTWGLSTGARAMIS